MLSCVCSAACLLRSVLLQIPPLAPTILPGVLLALKMRFSFHLGAFWVARLPAQAWLPCWPPWPRTGHVQEILGLPIGDHHARPATHLPWHVFPLAFKLGPMPTHVLFSPKHQPPEEHQPHKGRRSTGQRVGLGSSKGSRGPQVLDRV